MYLKVAANSCELLEIESISLHPVYDARDPLEDALIDLTWQWLFYTMCVFYL